MKVKAKEVGKEKERKVWERRSVDKYLVCVKRGGKGGGKRRRGKEKVKSDEGKRGGEGEVNGGEVKKK